MDMGQMYYYYYCLPPFLGFEAFLNVFFLYFSPKSPTSTCYYGVFSYLDFGGLTYSVGRSVRKHLFVADMQTYLNTGSIKAGRLFCQGKMVGGKAFS